MFDEFEKLNSSVMAYEDARAVALRRDFYRCCACFSNGSDFRLETHHRNKEAYGPLWSQKYNPCRPLDLATFCERCHDTWTDRDRKMRFSLRDYSSVGKEIYEMPKPQKQQNRKASDLL
jgi:hypothetical protein